VSSKVLQLLILLLTLFGLLFILDSLSYGYWKDIQKRRAAALMDDLITPIKLHSNCTQLHPGSQNTTEIDELMPVMAEKPDKTPK
jgi:hypothetical protein